METKHQGKVEMMETQKMGMDEVQTDPPLIIATLIAIHPISKELLDTHEFVVIGFRLMMKGVIMEIIQVEVLIDK